MTQLLLLAWMVSAVPGQTSAGESWPAFRGDGSSLAAATHLPTDWSDTSNIAWTAPVAGYGQSSPVIWGGRVIVTSALGDRKEKGRVSAFDLNSGRELWNKDFPSSQPQEVSNYVSRAAPTPAIDADGVYAFFETGDLVALDHAGSVLWQRSLTGDYGEFRGNHGLGSSLALTGDAVLVLVCHDGPSYLLAVDRSSGKVLWKADRPQAVSWSSPIYDAARREVIVSSSGVCEAIDAATGKQIWRVEGIEGNTVPSATVTKDRVIVGSSEVGSNMAIRNGGRGDVTSTHVAWQSTEATATFSSPLVYQGHVYMVNRAGVAFCLDAASGETVWTHRLGDSCWASPLGAEDRVYFFGKGGKTTLVAAGPKLKVLAENALTTDDRVYGVAAVNRSLVVRNGSKLICIRQSTDNESETTMSDERATPAKQPQADENILPDLPQAITSFGAAVIDHSLFVYGGHHGTPHHYSQAGQSGKLLRLDLKKPTAWKEMASGPKLQGMGMVAHGGKLYRVGGFSARNPEGEPQDLWSVDDFASYDPRTNRWTELPALPSPRSSFDAVLVDDMLYVAGGWDLRGDRETVWHDTALAINLAKQPLAWQELPKAPFQRRAMSLGTLEGKVYVIGGMQPDGKVTRETAIYDPAKREWSAGPELPEGEMEGFGTACHTLEDRLYVSTISGKLLRLSDEGKSWELVETLPRDRFFHRMVPYGESKLILLGGASMKVGKFSSVEFVNVAPVP